MTVGLKFLYLCCFIFMLSGCSSSTETEIYESQNWPKPWADKDEKQFIILNEQFLVKKSNSLGSDPILVPPYDRRIYYIGLDTYYQNPAAANEHIKAEIATMYDGVPRWADIHTVEILGTLTRGTMIVLKKAILFEAWSFFFGDSSVVSMRAEVVSGPWKGQTVNIDDIGSSLQRKRVRDSVFADILGESANRERINSSVPVAIYSNLVCESCQEILDIMIKLRDELGEKLSMHFFHALNSTEQRSCFQSDATKIPCLAAIYSECAAQQGYFWEYIEKIVSRPKSQGLTVKLLEQWYENLPAQSLNLEQCRQSEVVHEKILEDMNRWQAKEFLTVPLVYMNGLHQPPMFVHDKLRKEILELSQKKSAQNE